MLLFTPMLTFSLSYISLYLFLSILIYYILNEYTLSCPLTRCVWPGSPSWASGVSRKVSHAAQGTHLPRTDSSRAGYHGTQCSPYPGGRKRMSQIIYSCFLYRRFGPEMVRLKTTYKGEEYINKTVRRFNQFK